MSSPTLLRLKLEKKVPGIDMVDSWHALSSSDIVQKALPCHASCIVKENVHMNWKDP